MSGLHPAVKRGMDALIAVARANGIEVKVTSTVRSRRTQLRLYNDYLAGRSRFPAAPPGKSKHERGLAFDLHVRPESALTPLGELWESWGGRWGGRFRDPIHFEV